ncbi:MAG: hypothetical protein RL409_209, partial [Gemmatimonadota bacterium]
KSLAAYPDLIKPAVALALATEARALIADSQKNYVPVDQSTLQGKAFVDEAKVEGGRVSLDLGYKGPYAAAIHENPRAGKTGGVSPSGRKYQHYATTGGWKFLELPLMAAEKGMLGRLADGIRNSIGGKLAGGAGE